MDMNFDFQPVYPRHDLMIEIGEVEMAIDDLRDIYDASAEPDLQARMENLLDALDHLAA